MENGGDRSINSDISTEELIKYLRLCAVTDRIGCAGDCKFGESYPLNFECIDELMAATADRLEETNNKLNEMIQQQIEETKKEITRLRVECSLSKNAENMKGSFLYGERWRQDD